MARQTLALHVRRRRYQLKGSAECIGHLVADVVAIIGTLDIVWGK